MTDQQKQFLHLCIVEQMKYKEISQKLNVPNTTLTIWYQELKEERLKIAKIRTIWTRKKIKVGFSEFYKWYLNNVKRCFYCDITEEEIHQLIENGRLKTKRIKTRGKKLELDRKKSDIKDYSDLDNLVFSCYWCNNAKTDTFTAEEFKTVGKVFNKIWKNRLEI